MTPSSPAMDPHHITGDASNHHATGADKRKRKADTLTDDANDVVDVGPSRCCSCVLHCHCGCHYLGEPERDQVYLDSLPVGYRFDPTDEELITHYLLKKIKNESLPKNKIGNADIYGNHPKDIVVNYPQAIEGAWYFFTSRNRKYVNGKRPSRKAGFGYWKATGPDHGIVANGTKIGGRKSLVYHEGHPPKGTKTDWMMQEYVVVGYQRQRSNLQDMKLDDYVLCKIYTNTKSGKESSEQLVNDQQLRVALNDQAAVPCQDTPKQESGSSDFQAENNVGVPHFQNSNHSTVTSYDQQMNPTVEKRVKEVNRSLFHVENNVEKNQPDSDSYRQTVNPNVENGVREARRRIIVNDHETRRGAINIQFENNVVVQNNCQRHLGSFYDPMTPYPSSLLQPVQRTSFPRIRPPLRHDYFLPRFNHNYSVPNRPYLPPTPTKSAPPPPRVTNAAQLQMHQGMYWSGSSSGPSFQEGYDYDGIELFNNDIVDMYTQDENGLLGDNYRLPFDGHEEVDVGVLKQANVEETKEALSTKR